MAEVDVVIGKKRRLPLWMLGVTAADQVRKSGKDDEYFELNEEKPLQKPLRSKLKPIAKRAGKRKISHEKEASEVQPVLLVRCDKRETISKSGKKAANSDNVAGKDCKTSLEKLKNRRRGKGSVTEHASPRMRKMENHGLERSDGFEGSPASEESGDDDGELTMEDLISMAEQYVKADNQTSRSEPKLEHKIPQPSKKPIFSRREWGLEPVKSGQEASMSVTVGPTIAHSIDTERKARETFASQGQTVGTGITKDPTDDMLELFLGPLFKKPQIEEVETTFVEEDDEHNFSQDIARVEEEAPLMKKKSSSLKDTVAMFF